MITDINFWILTSIVLLLVAGLYCLLITRNMIRILIALEILTKAVTLLLAAVGYLTGWNTISQSFIITLIVIEIVVIVVSCGIILGVYRHHATLNTDQLTNLKG